MPVAWGGEAALCSSGRVAGSPGRTDTGDRGGHLAFSGQEPIKVKTVKPPAKVQIPQEETEETEEEEEETAGGCGGLQSLRLLQSVPVVPVVLWSL